VGRDNERLPIWGNSRSPAPVSSVRPRAKASRDKSNCNSSGRRQRRKPEWVEVDTANVRVENQLDFGGPWLALEVDSPIQLDELFENVIPQGREDIPGQRWRWCLSICRLCNPSSELHIAEHYYKSTALPELLGVPDDKVYDERFTGRWTSCCRTRRPWKST
jgi:hypothetical protein